MWIKICGTTNPEDARLAVEAGADAVGFVFAPSPRRVTPDVAAAIAAGLPPRVEKVGVFVDQTAAAISKVVNHVGLTGVQLQGDETPEFVESVCKELRDGKRGPRLRVFKVVSVVPGMEGALRRFAHVEAVDGLVLDSAIMRAGCAGQGTELIRGGTGVSFDWKRVGGFVSGVARRTRVILAGGLKPETVVEAVRILHPWGVDVCSGVEASPGRKDPDKLRAFVAAARSA